MVETISPVVHGGRRTSYLMSVTLHTLGAAISAALLGALLGGIGAVVGAPWGSASAVIVALVALAYAARELLGLPIPIPDRHRQVPEWWRTFYSAPTAAALYGIGLGVGFFTFLSFGTFVAVAAGAVALGNPLLGAALCAPFGIARGLSVLVAARTDEGKRTSELVDRVADLGASAGPRLINGVALAAVGVLAVLAA